MPKLTIEIDSEAPQEEWDALYRRIQEHAAAVAQGEAEAPKELTQAEVDHHRRIFWATEMGGISD